MPRNSNGDYSLPPGSLVSTGDTVLVSQHNPPLSDIEQSLSSSLDRDGRGGMRAPLAMGGNKITGASPGTDPTDVATVSQLASSDTMPIGAVIDYWGTVPPSGYLFAAGQAVSRTTYAALFAVIGTAAGAGDGSTTFNLPDYGGRVSAGRETTTARLNTLSSGTLGAKGGAQTHTLTTAEMPAHTHPVTDPGHMHTESGVLQSNISSDGFISGAVSSSTNTGTATTGITIGSTGGGGAHNNVQPTIIANKIIKVS